MNFVGRFVVRVAVVLAVAVAAAACTASPVQRVALLTTDGLPITVAPEGDQLCIEVGNSARLGSWCNPNRVSEAVRLGATSTSRGLLVIAQAPGDVESIVLTGDQGLVRPLRVKRISLGRFFFALHVPPGSYDVVATTSDGTHYVSAKTSFPAGGTTTTTMTP